MARHIRDFFTALACLKTSRQVKPALWATVGSMIFIATAQTTAYGLEFPMTTRLTLPASKNLTASGILPSASLLGQTSEMALVAYMVQQVEAARAVSPRARTARLRRSATSSCCPWGS